MQTLNFSKVPVESIEIASIVKQMIIGIDPTASVFLFGSRARGDADSESDWDFLVLTYVDNIEKLSDKLRKIMLRQVELKYDVGISLLVKNIAIWESDYAVTNIYESIKEEGIEI